MNNVTDIDDIKILDMIKSLPPHKIEEALKKLKELLNST